MENQRIFVNDKAEFLHAAAALSDGGNIILCGRVEIDDVRIPAHGRRLTLTAKGGALVFSDGGRLTLGGETVFEDVTLDVGSTGMIIAAFHPLTFSSGVTVNSDLAPEKNGLYLVGGDCGANAPAVYAGDASIRVYSGKISRIFAFSANCPGASHTGKADIAVGGEAYVRYVVAGATGQDATANCAALTLSGHAVIETLMVGGNQPGNTLHGDFSMFADGGDVYCFHHLALTNAKGRRSLIYVPQTAADGLVFLASLVRFDSIQSVCDVEGHTFGDPLDNPFDKAHKVCRCARCGFVKAATEAPATGGEHNVVYAADGGFGDGSAPYLPLGSFDAAMRKLGEDGGTIVLVGKCTLNVNLIDRFGKMADAYQAPRHSKKITVTSLHDGVDYRTRGAALIFPKNIDLRLSGPMDFEEMTFSAADGVTENKIAARYQPLRIGKGCKTPCRADYALDIIGGYLGFRYTDLDGLRVTDEWDEVVNAVRPLPVDFHFDDLEPVEEGSPYLLRRAAAEAFRKMYADMEALGMKKPYISDAYRTYARQYQLFSGSVWRLRCAGHDFETARQIVLRSCGLPLSSEHHRGVAVDMYDKDLIQFGAKKHHYYYLTREWAWVMQNGAQYGIILRYPHDKENTTGIIYEPWHFSYVGRDTAVILHACGFSMEEYLGAKLGCFHQNAEVTVESGSYRSITAASVETQIQFTGAHRLTVADTVDHK